MALSNRITQHYTSQATRDQLAKTSYELFHIQQQISSGLRIQRPSDDPAGIRRSLIQKDRIDRLESQTTSLQHVRSRMESAHVQLREASNLLLRAKNIALQAQQATEPAEISVLASELEGVLQGLNSVANSSDESGYLFSGTAANTKPFPNIQASNGLSQYAGTTEFTQLHLTGDIDRNALLPGSLIFQPSDREPTVVISRTGAAAGTGVDTARGIRQLQVRHVSTTYAPGSGIGAGTSSATGDTIIGAAGEHSLEVTDTSGTGAFGTISLNGGLAVNFTSSDTDLVVTDSLGRRISVDTTAITPGFSGSIDLTATGTLSLDGGTSSVPITFGANDVVTDSRDGSVVFINSSQIVETGTDQLEFPGTSDVFATVANLKNDILNTRNLSPSDRNKALSRRLEDILRVHDHVLDTIGIQSVSMEQMERLKTRAEDLTLAEKVEYSDTVSADITEAVLRLQEIQTLQQFAYAAIAKVLTPSLLNYLQ